MQTGMTAVFLFQAGYFKFCNAVKGSLKGIYYPFFTFQFIKGIIKMKKIIFSLLCAFSLMACNQESAQSQPTPESTSANSAASNKPLATYKVISYPYTPFIIRDEKGQMSGFESEILQAIEQKQNIRFDFVPMLVEWNVLFDVLDRKEGDLLSAAMYANPERAERFDLSQPYMETQFVFLNDKNTNIKQFSDLKGKRIAVFQGTIAAKELQSLPFAKEIKFVWVKSVYEAVKAVAAGQADVAYGDYVVLSYYANELKEQGIHVTFNPEANKYQFVFLIAKGNTELLQHINAGLAAIQADGTLDKIKQKWLKNE